MFDHKRVTCAGWGKMSDSQRTSARTWSTSMFFNTVAASSLTWAKVTDGGGKQNKEKKKKKKKDCVMVFMDNEKRRGRKRGRGRRKGKIKTKCSSHVSFSTAPSGRGAPHLPLFSPHFIHLFKWLRSWSSSLLCSRRPRRT